MDALERDLVSERCRTRLRLTWNDQGEHIDTREDRNARAAECLVARIGQTCRGRSQRRAVAKSSPSTEVVTLQCAIDVGCSRSACHHSSVGLVDRSVPQGDGSSRISWWKRSRNAAVRRMECTSRDHAKLGHLGLMDCRNLFVGFPRSPPGSHIAARAQRDRCRVSLLETVFVLLTIQFGREGVVPEVMDVVAPRPQVRTNNEICADSWNDLTRLILMTHFCRRSRC